MWKPPLKTTGTLAGAVLFLSAAAPSPPPPPSPAGVVVNDVHSRLNETRVHRIVSPDSLPAIQAAVRAAQAEGRAISIAGGRHAMGGQQFGKDTILVDMTRMDKVL